MGKTAHLSLSQIKIKNMPKFTVTETVPCVQVWTYEVEAANETEAIEMVVQGKVQSSETVVDEHDYDETHFEVEDSE